MKASELFILYPCRWSHYWPKHAEVRYLYKTNFSIVA